MHPITRWTGFVYLAPHRYCDPVVGARLDIEAWSALDRFVSLRRRTTVTTDSDRTDAFDIDETRRTDVDTQGSGETD